MSYKLPGMRYEEGRCFDVAHCGCRFWGNVCGRENLTYVSYEKVDGEFLPIEVEGIQGTGPQIITSRLHVTFRSKKCYYVIMYLLQPLAAPPPFPSSVATVSSPSISPSVVVVVVVVVFA